MVALAVFPTLTGVEAGESGIPGLCGIHETLSQTKQTNKQMQNKLPPLREMAFDRKHMKYS